MSPTDENQTTLELHESALKTVWPTIAATPAGRLVGRCCEVKLGLGSFFTLGKLLALVTLPISLAVFAWQLLPIFGRRYALTTHRIVIRHGLKAVDGRSIGLDEFDDIRVDVLPGQAWLHSGELVFLRAGSEVFRLSGVSRPEPLRQLCLRTRHTVLGVRKALREEMAGQPSG